ncbi:MAG: DegT/DnrJ/EryC1/StrS family aminotransferase [Leptolyngbyaceae cyanobacterium MO_188.B28]|nr:DegT/DnrJ/EryC1/StrS family aminotransferase [Leptolyngbyaceae cyanobacterium MO_188.B28]
MKPIPVNEPYLARNASKYLQECIDTGWISSEGPFVQQFETQFATLVNRKYGVAVCNGSAALEVAIAALKIGSGDEVILPTFTIISCATAIVRAGAIPVVVDSDPHTWNMDVAQIETKITPRTKAIMVVHIYGLPVDVVPIIKLADQYGLAIIEDAAEMHGQTYRGRPCGSFGDISTFSFYANKHITTGEGGMVLTDDEELAERCRSLRNLCFQPQQRFIHEELGWNFRMTNLQAAVGVAQLEELPACLIRKRKIGQYYNELLANISGLQQPMPRTDYAENIYWVYGVVLCNERSETPAEVMKQLAARKIGARPFFWPMHEQPVFRKMGLFAKESCPVAEKLARRGFYLPSGAALTDDAIEQVATALKEVLA